MVRLLWPQTGKDRLSAKDHFWRRSGRSPICRLRLKGAKPTGHSTTAMLIALTCVNERRNGTIDFHPKGTPHVTAGRSGSARPGAVVGIAQPGQTRER
jgi:hypothetical protein